MLPACSITSGSQVCTTNLQPLLNEIEIGISLTAQKSMVPMDKVAPLKNAGKNLEEAIALILEDAGRMPCVAHLMMQYEKTSNDYTRR